jgi:hypothetical protein
MLPQRPRPQQLLRYAWPDTAEQCEAFAARFPAARGAAGGRAFVTIAADGSTLARCTVPLLLPPVAAGESPMDYAARLPERIGRQCVLLLQAGAAALGYWDEDDLLHHKAIKKYVVRGTGKAQPTHLKTKGKSRYGSRLRLQNWRRLLVAVNTRLGEWWQLCGAPEQVFTAVNVRVLPELFATDPPPPFARDDATLRRVPRHVHVPDFAELCAVRAFLAGGRVELFLGD